MTARVGRTMYRVYYFGGRPIFAVPSKPRRLRLAGLARYQPVTPKRAAYRSLMYLSMMAGADGLLSTTTDNPIGGDVELDFERWMTDVRHVLSDEQATGVVFWPPQRDRGRIYVHLFGEDLRPLAFAKIAFDDHNSQCLHREAQTVGTLGERNLRTFRVPRVVSLGEVADAVTLVLESIPIAARPIESSPEAYPAGCVVELAGTSRHVDVQELSWWHDNDRRDDNPFWSELAGFIGRGVPVCRAHGDFVIGNIVREGDRLWIFDWEESRPDAPVLTDEVAFFMGLYHARVLADPIEGLRLLAGRFLDGADGARRRDVMMALAFRDAIGIEAATLLIRNWSELP